MTKLIEAKLPELTVNTDGPGRGRLPEKYGDNTNEDFTNRVLANAVELGNVPRQWLEDALAMSYSRALGDSPRIGIAAIRAVLAPTIAPVERELGEESAVMKFATSYFLATQIRSQSDQLQHYIDSIGERNFNTENERINAKIHAEDKRKILEMYLPQLEKSLQQFALDNWGPEAEDYRTVLLEIMTRNHSDFPRAKRPQSRKAIAIDPTITREKIVLAIHDGDIKHAKQMIEALPKPRRYVK